MKILIFMRGYFPGNNYGGPPVSIRNLTNNINEIETYIVTTDHDFKSSRKYDNISEGWNIIDNANVLYLSDCEFTRSRIKKILAEISPDILYLQSVFEKTSFICLTSKIIKKTKVFLAPRGELCKGALKQKRIKKILYLFFLRFFRLVKGVFFQATSDEERDGIIQCLRVPDKYIICLDNIPSIPKKRSEFWCDKKRDYLSLVYISRITRKKNLHLAINALKEVSENVSIDIYGAKEDMNYWDDCKSLMDTLPNNICVNYKGILQQGEVVDTFAKYDAFIFLTSSENYGHVIVESLFAGCPVILSPYTPWTDLEDNKAGWIIDIYGNLNKISTKISDLAKMSNEEFLIFHKCAIEYITKKIDFNHILSDYLTAFQRISNE